MVLIRIKAQPVTLIPYRNINISIKIKQEVTPKTLST